MSQYRQASFCIIIAANIRVLDPDEGKLSSH